jgi:hypothetical protein
MTTIHSLKTAGIVGALALGLTACNANRGPERVDSAEPTLTYTYDGSERELEQARFDAEDECREEYGRDADLVDTYRDGEDTYIAVFECD